MACEICGSVACTRCFHSLEEQEEFDSKTGRYAEDDDRYDCPIHGLQDGPDCPRC